MPLRCRTTSYSALLILTLVGHYSATLRGILPSDGNKQASNEYRRSDTLFISCACLVMLLYCKFTIFGFATVSVSIKPTAVRKKNKI
ncbi:hypothetical protein DFO54_109144 [Erwinia sp. AG740]|nr:hypothetical protein DFO54_109144 [Erwinia sp. AG740]